MVSLCKNLNPIVVDDCFGLHNKVAIVTGGGRGPGVPISHALAERGANV